MRIVVTGPSGFVGRALVPLLLAAKAEILLCGRDPDKLARCFPNLTVCDYADLPERAKGYDSLLHLAVINTNAEASEAEFRTVNVDLTIDLAQTAAQAGIKRFVNISSVHALNPRDDRPYARTKREAASLLKGVQGIEIVTLYLPMVYHDTFAGKLAVLNKLPKPLARAVFLPLAALKPTVHLEKLAKFLLSSAPLAMDAEIILYDDQDRNIVYRAVKRMLDLIFVLTIVGLLGWAMVLIWVLVRWQSPGPGIFAQERVGRNGKVFVCYKFRTMKQGTVQVGTHEVSAAAVTSLGQFLRKTKLDELPQIWNILRNEVSLIGPRPCLPSQTELIAARQRWGVSTLKPGISGLAQINGFDMSEPETLARWDARYKATRSLLLDLKIAVATARGGGQGDKVRE